MPEDAELDLFRQAVNCAAVLERMATGWKLDARESTRSALKYRRGAGEIIIVNHNGRGWWDATGSAKGDVFNLVQHLDPSLNFGDVRRLLRGFVGIAPTYPEATRTRSPAKADMCAAGTLRRCAEEAVAYAMPRPRDSRRSMTTTRTSGERLTSSAASSAP